MQSNKEHVRAHAFVSRRMVAAVVEGRPDGWQRPLGRTSTGALMGFALATVLVLGFLVFGLIKPGSGPGLREKTTVVVEKETGTRYLVDGGVLRPVTNLASALLAAGPALVVQTLPRRRTAQLPRGNPVGIVGAPDDVPTAAGVVASWWSECVPVPDTPDDAPSGPGTLSFGVGAPPVPVPDATALLVRGPDGDVHLVIDGVRHALDSIPARTALGYASTVPVQVPRPWLAALPPGRAFEPVDVGAAGRPGPVLAGRRTSVGQVLVVRTPLGAPQYHAVTTGGVVTLTEVEARLVLANPVLAKINPGGDPLLVEPAVVAGATRGTWARTQGWPAQVPRPADVTGRDLCVAAGPLGHPWVGTAPAGTARIDGTSPVVRVPAASGVVVEAGAPGGSSSGALSLVDDLGRRYDIADADTLAALGLASAERLRVPAGLLAAVPAGPALDVAAVRAGG